MGKRSLLCFLFLLCFSFGGCTPPAQAPLPPTEQITLSGSAVSREEAPFSVQLDYTLCRLEGQDASLTLTLFLCGEIGTALPATASVLTVGKAVLPFETKGETLTNTKLCCYTYTCTLPWAEVTDGVLLSVCVKTDPQTYLTAQTVLQL